MRTRIFSILFLLLYIAAFSIVWNLLPAKIGLFGEVRGMQDVILHVSWAIVGGVLGAIPAIFLMGVWYEAD